MDQSRTLFGLSAQAKARLLEKLSSAASARPTANRRRAGDDRIPSTSRLDASELDGFQEIRMIREAAEFLGIDDPFFRVHEGIAGAETLIGNRTYVNFA